MYLQTLSWGAYIDAPGAAEALARHRLPAYFLDSEIIYFAVPIWKGTRPYQQIPFQFGVHRLLRAGKFTHDAFLNVPGQESSRALPKHCLRIVAWRTRFSSTTRL